MQIAIIGTGNVGGALARAWARAGHRIFLGVRNLQDQKVLALTAGGAQITAHPPAEAVKDAETVLFAIPPNALRQVLDNLGDLKGKVLIDATNSVRAKAGDFGSVADALRSWTKSTDVVKCFNITGFNVMENPQVRRDGGGHVHGWLKFPWQRNRSPARAGCGFCRMLRPRRR